MATTSEEPSACTESTGPLDPVAGASADRSLVAHDASAINLRQQSPSVDAVSNAFGSSSKHAEFCGSAKDLRDAGQALVTDGDYEGAAAKLRAGLALDPDDRESYDAYSTLADTLANAERFG